MSCSSRVRNIAFNRRTSFRVILDQKQETGGASVEEAVSFSSSYASALSEHVECKKLSLLQ